MKTNIPGIIITVIITFNLLCLVAYFIVKGIQDRRDIDENEKE